MHSLYETMDDLEPRAIWRSRTRRGSSGRFLWEWREAFSFGHSLALDDANLAHLMKMLR